METIDNVLKYIQLYTECNDFTLKRIRVLIEKLQTEKIVYKTIYEEKVKYIQKKPVADNSTLEEWAEGYLKFHGLEYKDVAKRSRAGDTIAIRNAFCVAAYLKGYSYSSIGRYLKLNHSSVMHCINKIKRI
jgi:hypothetical protein